MTKQEDKYTRRKLKSSYITTVVSISLVLFVLGLLGLVMMHGQKLSIYIRENIGMSLIINDNILETSILDFKEELEKSSFVKKVDYITKAQAAQELEEALGEDFITFIGYNPLLPSLEVRLNASWTNVDSMLNIERLLSKNKNVKEVIYQKSLVHLVNENIRRIGFVLTGFSVLLLIIAIALINNTIRLSVYSKRFLIRSMQLVGATQGFIRKPFMLQGVFHGIYGAVFALLLLTGVLYFARQEIPELASLQDIDMFAMIAGTVVLLGVCISSVSTFFAVRKYLHSSLDNLYQ